MSFGLVADLQYESGEHSSVEKGDAHCTVFRHFISALKIVLAISSRFLVWVRMSSDAQSQKAQSSMLTKTIPSPPE
jgi:hypothetical protein